MRRHRRSHLVQTTSLAAVLLALLLGANSAAADWGDYRLRMKADGDWVELTEEDLKNLSTGDRAATRGQRQRKIIPLTVLLEDALGAELDKVTQVLLVNDERSLLLEAGHLQHLGQLEMKLGKKRPAVQPVDDTTWRALQPEFGQPRFKDVETIFVWIQQPKGLGRGDGKGKGQASQIEDGAR